MMKARQYNRRIFTENITPKLIAVRNPQNISTSVLKRLGGLEPLGLRLIEDFQDAEEYGSILQVNYTEEELQRLEQKLEEIKQDAQYGNLLTQIEAEECIKLIQPLITQARLLSQKYDVVVTNPPYMGANGMGVKLTGFVKEKYPDTKSDLSTVFMERCLNFCMAYGLMSMINIPVWMFLPSYEKFRINILLNKTYINLVHPGRGIFGSDFGSTAFVINNYHISGYISSYRRLFDKQGAVETVEELERLFLLGKGAITSQQDNSMKIPGAPVAYWISKNFTKAFENPKLGEIANPKKGLDSADNERFTRYWYEPNITKVGFGLTRNEAIHSKFKWFPLNSGGGFRKWYGNFEKVVNWENDGAEMSSFPNAYIRSREKYFQEGLTWTKISSSKFGVRYAPKGFVFDSAGQTVFCDHEYIWFLLGLLCSEFSFRVLQLVNPTINYQVGDVSKIPVKQSNQSKIIIDSLVCKNIDISQSDWDSFETSWDFRRHPLVKDRREYNDQYTMNCGFDVRRASVSLISNLYERWERQCNDRFSELKSNEEELNRIFIDIYDLQDELNPEVADKDVTVRKADLGREIRSLISYAIGCMFGRYSIYKDGLVFAGGKMEDHFSYYDGTWNDTESMTWDQLDKHTWDDIGKSFYYIPQEGKTPLDCWKVDADNCIPITDEEYFQDDIVGYFVDFIRDAYGADYVEENLDFIAKALGNKGNTSREVIRNYFLNDFYKDHLKIYQKRPIYWLFDSGKQNGFKALVYMHRWNADTVGNLRIEYLHKMQTVYEHEIDTCQDMIEHGSGRDVAVASKRKEKLVKQLKECRDYDALVAHIAFSKISIDLDDGVKVNYRKVQTGADGKFCEILADSKDIMAKEK